MNDPIKIHRVAHWKNKNKKNKQVPTICCLQENHVWAKDTYIFKVRGWKKIFHESGNDRKVGVAILISDKIHLKQMHRKDKEEH